MKPESGILRGCRHSSGEPPRAEASVVGYDSRSFDGCDGMVGRANRHGRCFVCFAENQNFAYNIFAGKLWASLRHMKSRVASENCDRGSGHSSRE